MAKWRLAKSLETLRDQVNALSPNRSKASDGTVGDAAHASRSSDHNPHVRDGAIGVVTAIDITDDEKHGIDSRKLGETLIASRDPRIKYVIADGQICSGAGGKSPWVWRKYTGKNSHHKHVHLSVKSTKALYDDTRPWSLAGVTVAPAKAAAPAVAAPRVLKKGDKGEDVRALQLALIAAGHNVGKAGADGKFGDGTDKALRAFQKAKGLKADGKAGAYTRDKLPSLQQKAAPMPKKASLIGGAVAGAVLDAVLDRALDKLVRSPSIPVQKEEAAAIKEVVKAEIVREGVAVEQHQANSEPWYQSRVTIGAIVAIVAGVGGFAGVTLDAADQIELVDGFMKMSLAVSTLVSAAGGVYAWYGRWRAKKPIGQ